MSCCERGGGERRGRLRIEADPAKFEQRLFDLDFGDRDGRAARAPERGKDFARPHGLRDRRAFRDRRAGLDWRQIIGPGHEACVKRRAVHGLRGEQPGQTCDLAAAEKFAEADVAAQDVAARASRDDDIVGRA